MVRPSHHCADARPDGLPQRAQLRARFISGPPPFWVLIHHPHHRAGFLPNDAEWMWRFRAWPLA